MKSPYLNQIKILIDKGENVSEMYTNGVYFIKNIGINNQNIEKSIDYIKTSINKGLTPIMVVLVLDFQCSDKDLSKIQKYSELLNISIGFLYKNEYINLIISSYKKFIPKFLFGVTGSSGKSSICYILYQLLNIYFNKDKNFLACSAGIGVTKLRPNVLSCAPFANMWYEMSREKDATVGILEITSHGIDQDRIHGIELDAALLTTIDMEHLDYHKTMENYIETKIKIIDYVKDGGFLLLNPEILENPYLSKKYIDLIYQKTQNKNIKIVYVENVLNLPNSLNKYQKFNISSALCFIKILEEKTQLRTKLTEQELSSINWDNILLPGRFEKIQEDKYNNTTVISDGAHNKDQIIRIMNLYQELYKKIIVIYGIAGHRYITDKNNPCLISNLLRNNDMFFIADDNPQDLDANFIKNEILVSCNNKEKIKVFESRFEAIQKSIKEKDTCVLILGKSSELSNIIVFTYMINQWEEFFYKQNKYIDLINRVFININDEKINKSILNRFLFMHFENNGHFLEKKIHKEEINYDVGLYIFETNSKISFEIRYNEQDLIAKIIKNFDKF